MTSAPDLNPEISKLSQDNFVKPSPFVRSSTRVFKVYTKLKNLEVFGMKKGQKYESDSNKFFTQFMISDKVNSRPLGDEKKKPKPVLRADEVFR